jgi:trans-2,3-dihydro-3-hydroxyanthranilate isomerase
VAAAVLGVPERSIRRVFSASLGVDFTYVQMSDPAAVDSAKLDQGAWTTHFAGKPEAQIYFFAGDLVDGGQLYARMFAPAFGIPEDPATGAASSILAGAGATLAAATGDRFSLTIDQGVAMGRPSRLNAHALLDNGTVSAVAVGGAATLVAQGEIQVPPQFLLD